MALTGTEPYPWPFDDDLQGDRLALVVAGAQDRWVSVSVGADAVFNTIATVARAVRATGGRVVFIRHGVTGRPLRYGRSVCRATHLALPSRQSGPWQLARPPDGDALVIDAGGYDGFHASTLDDELRADGRDLLVFCGFASEVLVDSTVRSANDRGYECLTVRDACAPIDRVTGARALASVCMSGGIFGAVGSAEDLCGALPSSRPTVVEENA